jgi:hypothetical protein
VVAAIALPDLFDSQLIVFFGPDYWSTFFDRHDPEQRWNRLESGRSLSREWSLEIPDGFGELGFEEVIVADGYEHRGELWFVGDLIAAPPKKLYRLGTVSDAMRPDCIGCAANRPLHLTAPGRARARPCARCYR